MAQKTLNPDLAEALEQLGNVTGIDPDTAQSLLAQTAQNEVNKAQAKAGEQLRKKLAGAGGRGGRRRRRASAAE